MGTTFFDKAGVRVGVGFESNCFPHYRMNGWRWRGDDGRNLKKERRSYVRQEKSLRRDNYVSQLVDAESARGDEDAAKRRQEFLSGLTWIEYGPAALDLARKFLDAAAISETSFDDATHVAIATIAKMDYLATWNCKHINNPKTLPKIIKVCEENGFKCPLIGTPDQLKEVCDAND